jgi:hypothetical protein
MKARHIYNSTKTDDDIVVTDTFSIEVEGQRQDSLHDQLKDLVRVAENIGCYDAADFLKTHVEKVEEKEPRRIDRCHRCDNKIIQQDMLDSNCSYLCGCKLMTKQEWEKGKPCPLTKFPRS